ncbi:uroporphyrin-III C-methyltransferase / precorrin-2 dehydrogenase / sirohydrochlorin ferrochelatase [Monaibacterium marinum]|uniref:Uroporphyrin-III C-methyltransferase / precorrin-2 dehydrogenase / sirohydrochlorin ferrochelatase n=1 Tax=Pontivivens marinum TaxID=1690039 RepID=A0A2C9CML9_9RHOB|nr:siroheme synthase CysG [Monaibacterium marinum]SOH92435.1 uroporphyrin-III C-methyltransferase / precorrin-2 dehydrogenase / sirohydrochlorin ferrochelatase [Monaibacterium marinum]
MKSFPMFIRTSGRRVVIVGGGEQAAQKTRLILKTDAQIVLAAPILEAELQAVVAENRAIWDAQPVTAETFTGAAMAFIATGCAGHDAALHALATAARCPVNVVDRPDLCDITTPSIVDRDPVVVAIGTEGTAPVLARQIKTQVEQSLAPTLGGLAAFAGRMRNAVARDVPRENRRAFWRWVFAETPRQKWVAGQQHHAIGAIKSAMASGGDFRQDATGSIALVGAGPGARDLLTLRAVERLQEADIIFYDRLVCEEVLELARRDAERVFVGKVVGAHAWPQERINAVIVAEARKGRRVVRLKSGDPGIFGRAAEEMTAAQDAGIDIEIVPGITAACAAAAAAGATLTERGVANTLVLTTGMAREGAPLPETLRHTGPGTTTALYMSVAQAPRLVAELQERGMPACAPVTVGANVSKPDQRMLQTTLAALPSLLVTNAITGCTVLLITWPESMESTTQQPNTPALCIA